MVLNSEKEKTSQRIRNIPTIITSAQTNLEKMEKMPHETFLSKPFDLNDVFHILKEYCNVTE